MLTNYYATIIIGGNLNNLSGNISMNFEVSLFFTILCFVCFIMLSFIINRQANILFELLEFHTRSGHDILNDVINNKIFELVLTILLWIVVLVVTFMMGDATVDLYLER